MNHVLTRLLAPAVIAAALAVLVPDARAQTPSPPAEAASAAQPAAPAASDASPAEPAASAPPAPAPEPPPSCIALTARAMAADLRAATAHSLKRELDTQAKLLDEAIQLWSAAEARCEDRAKARASRHLADNQKQRASIGERQAAGAQCEHAHRDAAALQEMARQAFGERRWPDAASLYGKAETMWEMAAEQCSGAQQQIAQQRRQQSEIDAHNAEFCAPQFERAREHTQKFRNSAAGLAVADKQRASLEAETLWRTSASNCKGSAMELAQNNAQALARERGTPWVATYPAGMSAAAPAAAAAATSAAAPGATSKPAAGAPASASAKPAAASVAANTAATAAVKTASTPVAAATAEPPAVAREIDIRAGDTRYQGLFVREEGQVVSGTGRVEWANGDVYQGELLRSKRHGKGELRWANGQRYSGDWLDDKPTGRGTLRFANGDEFSGTVVDGVPEGEGELVYGGGGRYKGQVSRGVPHGKGRYQWANGQVFEGDWVNDQPRGQGQLRFANGNVYEGQVDNGQPHGKGRMRYAGTGEYEGEFERGIAQGQGRYSWPSGESYEGGWRAGLKHGRGVYRWSSGERWEGIYQNDQQTEQGELIRKPENTGSTASK